MIPQTQYTQPMASQNPNPYPYGSQMPTAQAVGVVEAQPVVQATDVPATTTTATAVYSATTAGTYTPNQYNPNANPNSANYYNPYATTPQGKPGEVPGAYQATTTTYYYTKPRTYVGPLTCLLVILLFFFIGPFSLLFLLCPVDQA